MRDGTHEWTAEDVAQRARAKTGPKEPLGASATTFLSAARFCSPAATVAPERRSSDPLRAVAEARAAAEAPSRRRSGGAARGAADGESETPFVVRAAPLTDSHPQV